MPAAAPLSLPVIALKLLASGEKFIQASFLNPELGIIRCMIRKRSKPPQIPVDLFDQGEAQIELKPDGRAGFLKDFVLVRRRQGLGHDYKRLEAASRLSKLILANPTHDDNAASIYDLAERTFDALAEGHPPTVVLLKAFYLYGREEGYPVKEEWSKSLPLQLSREVSRVLNTPLATLANQPPCPPQALDSLAAYLETRTHIHLT